MKKELFLLTLICVSLTAFAQLNNKRMEHVRNIVSFIENSNNTDMCFKQGNNLINVVSPQGTLLYEVVFESQSCLITKFRIAKHFSSSSRQSLEQRSRAFSRLLNPGSGQDMLYYHNTESNPHFVQFFPQNNGIPVYNAGITLYFSGNDSAFPEEYRFTPWENRPIKKTASVSSCKAIELARNYLIRKHWFVYVMSPIIAEEIQLLSLAGSKTASTWLALNQEFEYSNPYYLPKRTDTDTLTSNTKAETCLAWIVSYKLVQENGSGTAVIMINAETGEVTGGRFSYFGKDFVREIVSWLEEKNCVQEVRTESVIKA